MSELVTRSPKRVYIPGRSHLGDLYYPENHSEKHLMEVVATSTHLMAEEKVKIYGIFHIEVINNILPKFCIEFKLHLKENCLASPH